MKTKRLLALAGLALALGLVAVPLALGARSHVSTACESGSYGWEESTTGDVSYEDIGVDASASASEMALRSLSSASSSSGENRYCNSLASFSNTAWIQAGSSGLSAGDPVTLALTVTLRGELSALVEGPPTTAPWEYLANSDIFAGLDVTSPDRIDCHMEDGEEYCQPAEVGRFRANGHRFIINDNPEPPSHNYRQLSRYSWWWDLTSNRGEQRGDSYDNTIVCEFLTSPSCGGVAMPLPDPPPDYRGTRSILVDAFVGDRIQLDGWLTTSGGVQHGYAIANSPAGSPSVGQGFVVALAPAPGFQGLNLTYELAPPTSDLPPFCDPVAKQTDEDTPLQDSLSCDDESASTVTYALAGNAAHGHASVTSDGQYTYTPAPDFNGQDSFQVTATDAAGHVSAPATVNVTVLPVNDKPVCQPQSLQATVGTTAQLQADCSDVDGDPLTIGIASQGTKGTATVNGQTISYTATEAGSDSFAYSASDGTATGDPATVTVTNEAVPASMALAIGNGLVVFRKPPDDDRARFTGAYEVSQPIGCGEDVTFSLNTNVFAQTVPGSAFQSKAGGKCVYTRLAAGGTGGIKRLELNLATRTFLVALRDEVELSALTNPVTVELQIGGLTASQTIQMKQAKNRWTYPG